MELTEKSLHNAQEEMQIFKDVIVPHTWIDNGNGTVSCPECKSWFYKENAEYMRYCGHCGVAMKPLNSYWDKKLSLPDKIYSILMHIDELK